MQPMIMRGQYKQVELLLSIVVGAVHLQQGFPLIINSAFIPQELRNFVKRVVKTHFLIVWGCF